VNDDEETKHGEKDGHTRTSAVVMSLHSALHITRVAMDFD